MNGDIREVLLLGCAGWTWRCDLGLHLAHPGTRSHGHTRTLDDAASHADGYRYAHSNLRVLLILSYLKPRGVSARRS
jgi:hypothetical protein